MNTLLHKSQIVVNNLDVLHKLRKKVISNFLDHTMYDINDALTSILALCDMDDMKNIPKVKKYIQRINSLLSDLRVYHDNTYFNIRHVARNIVDVIKDSYKDNVNIEIQFVPFDAYVRSSQSQIEEILLSLLVEMTEIYLPDSPSLIDVDLHQKDQFAVLTIKKENFTFSDSFIEHINKLKIGLSGSLLIEKNGQSAVVQIKLPLDFTKPQFLKNIDVIITSNLKNKVNTQDETINSF